MPQDHIKLLVDEAGIPREECGVFGVFGADNAASLTAFGLHALQHRGQEACGIACFEGHSANEIPNERLGKGMVSEVFGDPTKLKKMSGHIAVGHVRYATRGAKGDKHATQPFFARTQSGSFSFAHNGQINNAEELRDTALKRNHSFRSNSDSETIVGAICVSNEISTIDRIYDAIHRIDGAYALVIATSDSLIGVRDPHGIRPLVLGRLRNGSGYILASESCALDIVEADLVRDIACGEIVTINKSGVQSRFMKNHNAQPRTCIFEYVYFSRPDSILDGRSVYESRYNMGLEMAKQELKKQKHAIGDVVISVPDSGNPAAMGFAKGLGLNYQMGIIRNHYVGRSFIESSQEQRALKVRMKHSPNGSVLKGKRVYVIDDSLVRGNTSRNISDMLKHAGAKEVHFRISCPQIRHSCIYGIDIPDNQELLSNEHDGNIDSISEKLQMDTIDFLSLEGLYTALGISEARDPKNPQFTDHYFTGDYPNCFDQQEIDPQLSLPLDIEND